MAVPGGGPGEPDRTGGRRVPWEKDTCMSTVGDQIFDLTKEVERLEKQCQRYEQTLQAIVAENPCAETGQHKCPACLATQALSAAKPPGASALAA